MLMIYDDNRQRVNLELSIPLRYATLRSANGKDTFHDSTTAKHHLKTTVLKVFHSLRSATRQSATLRYAIIPFRYATLRDEYIITLRFMLTIKLNAIFPC